MSQRVSGDGGGAVQLVEGRGDEKWRGEPTIRENGEYRFDIRFIVSDMKTDHPRRLIILSAVIHKFSR